MGTIKGSNWAKRYFRIVMPGFLQYWKTEDKANAGGTPQGNIDLRLAMSVKMHTHSSTGFKDACRVNIELADRTFKLRFADSAICQEWLDALVEWRDYSIDHAALMPTHHFYEEEEDGTGAGGAAPPTTQADGGGGGGAVAAADAEAAEAASSLLEEVELPEKPSLTTFKSLAPPDGLEGWLKKKATGSTKHWYDQWQERYFRIVPEDFSLSYFKSAEDDEAKGAIDLRALVAVGLHKSSRDVADLSRFDLDLGDGKKMRVKAESQADAERWIRGIREWKEHLLLNMEMP